MRSLTFLAVTSALAACSPYDPDLGGVPYQCGDTEPRCPSGYSCQDDGTGSMVCISANGITPDARPMGGFVCEDDGVLEGPDKNDTIATAYALSMPNINLGPVSICPEGDKDTYQIDVTQAMSNLEAVTTWTSGMPVSVSILNGGGTSINNGVSNGEMSLRAYAANLPVGRYYIQTYASATTKNNYRLAIKVTQ